MRKSSASCWPQPDTWSRTTKDVSSGPPRPLIQEAIILSYESSATVYAPVAAVWQILSEVEAWPTWTTTMSAVRGREGPALELGASFTIHQPKLRPATWVVTAFDPPRYFQWTSRLPGLRVHADHLVQASGPSACRLLLRVGFAGLLAPLLGRLARALTQAYLEQECASLKAVAEAKRQ